MKKSIAVMLAAVMTLSMAACGSKKSDDTTAAAETTGAQETTAAAGETSAAEMPEYVSAFDLGDISEYVELGEYKNIEVTEQDATVTDEDVENELQSQLENATPEYAQIMEGTVKDGDVVNIDFVGKMNGEEFQGGSGSDFNLTIGSGQFIDGFEDGLIGKNVGDTVTLDLTFPEDYSKTNTDLNGAAVEFTVTINYIQGEELARELNDAFVQKQTDGQYNTVDEYRAYIREDLESSNQDTAKKTEINEAWGKIKENATFKKDPEKLINYIHDSQMYQFESMLSMYGVDKATYLAQMGQTEEEFEESLMDYCRDSAQTSLLVRAIIEAENIDLTDTEYEEGLQTLAEENNMDADTMKTTYAEAMIRDALRQRRIQDFVEENLVRVPAAETSAAETNAAETSAAN